MRRVEPAPALQAVCFASLRRISVYGSIELTKDQAGLAQAKALKEVIDAVVAALEKEKSLPEHVQVKPTEKVKNPFG